MINHFPLTISAILNLESVGEGARASQWSAEVPARILLPEDKMLGKFI